MYHQPLHLVRRSQKRVQREGSIRRVARAFRRVATLPIFGLLVACGSDGTGLSETQLRIRMFAGDGQVALVGASLEAPLKVQVTDVASGAPVSGESVRWALTAGQGASLSALMSTTDDEGVAQSTLILGSQVGAYRVTATTRDATGTVGFGATAIAPLSVTGLSAPSAVAGSRIEIAGTGFDLASGPVVHFSGIPGQIVGASDAALMVDVPACLPSRPVEVRVHQAGQASDPLQLDVTASGGAVDLSVGEDLLFADTNLLRCRRVSFSQGGEYLITVRSDDVRGGVVHDYSLRGLGATGDIAASQDMFTGGLPPVGVARDWHDRVRRWEQDLQLPADVPALQGARSVLRTQPPAPGEMGQFAVLTSGGGLDTVQAVVRYVGDRVVMYEDLGAPASGLQPQDFASLAEEFDHPIYDVVTSVFGPPSDVDGNERVAVLFTPAVNRLTPRGSDGTVAGFFFTGDLVSTGEGAARGEVFYALVPDPTGVFSDPVDRASVLRNVPAVLAHEFQHMVHFNIRVLLGGRPQLEALWLAEALAQMAEDLVFEHYVEEGNSQRASEYRQGNFDRARRYLRDTGGVSLTVGSGAGTLPERGAGWLFARYLTDHFGGSRVLTDITQGPHLGVENVVAATGEPWTRTFSDWTIALALDGLDVGPARFSFPSVSLRALFGGATAAAVEGGLDVRTFERSRQINSASPRYHSIRATSDGELAITLTGQGAARLESASGIQMRIIRLQ